MPDNSFYITCPVCKGTGEVPHEHKFAIPQGGHKTGWPNPKRSGGCSGDIIAEAKLSYCAVCLGCGIKLKK